MTYWPFQTNCTRFCIEHVILQHRKKNSLQIYTLFLYLKITIQKMEPSKFHLHIFPTSQHRLLRCSPPDLVHICTYFSQPSSTIHYTVSFRSQINLLNGVLFLAPSYHTGAGSQTNKKKQRPRRTDYDERNVANLFIFHWMRMQANPCHPKPSHAIPLYYKS